MRSLWVEMPMARTLPACLALRRTSQSSRIVSVAAEPPPGLRFEYVRARSAADCPDEAAVRAGVVERVGHDPFSPAGERTLRCELTRDRRGKVTGLDQDGEITLSAKPGFSSDAELIRGGRVIPPGEGRPRRPWWAFWRREE